MIYTATVYYNEMGVKLTGRENVNIYVESVYALNEKQLTVEVEKQVPSQMIDNIVFKNTDLTTLNVGDWVKLTEPVTTTYSKQLNWKLVKIIEINDKGIKVQEHKGYFDFDGNEINPRKKKDIHYINLPTQDEIKHHEYQVKNSELINTLEDIFNNCEYYHLTNDDLENIIEIFNLYR